MLSLWFWLLIRKSVFRYLFLFLFFSWECFLIICCFSDCFFRKFCRKFSFCMFENLCIDVFRGRICRIILLIIFCRFFFVVFFVFVLIYGSGFVLLSEILCIFFGLKFDMVFSLVCLRMFRWRFLRLIVDKYRRFYFDFSEIDRREVGVFIYCLFFIVASLFLDGGIRELRLRFLMIWFFFIFIFSKNRVKFFFLLFGKFLRFFIFWKIIKNF